MREDKIMVVKAISVQDLKLPPNHVQEFIGTSSLWKSSTSTFDTRRCTAHVAISSWSDAENIIKTIALETQREAPLMSEAFVRCRHIFVQVIFLNDKWSEDDYMEIADWFLEEELKKLKRLQSFVCLLLSIFFCRGGWGKMACTPHRDSEMKMSMLYCTRIICLVWLHETVTANCITQGDVLCQQQFILFTFFSKPNPSPPTFVLSCGGQMSLPAKDWDLKIIICPNRYLNANRNPGSDQRLADNQNPEKKGDICRERLQETEWWLLGRKSFQEDRWIRYINAKWVVG